MLIIIVNTVKESLLYLILNSLIKFRLELVTQLCIHELTLTLEVILKFKSEFTFKLWFKLKLELGT